MSLRTGLRCDNGILFGILGDGVVEVKCRSARCGARPGIVILHRFSVADGSLLETVGFKSPQGPRTGKEG